MRSVPYLLGVMCVVLASCEQPKPPEPSAPPRPPPTVLDRAALLRGELPQGPEVTILYVRCLNCHTLDYVTQQRLTEAQWLKTLTKMQKWGSPLTDAERSALVPFLARAWSSELPEVVSPRGAAPVGALPL